MKHKYHVTSALAAAWLAASCGGGSSPPTWNTAAADGSSLGSSSGTTGGSPPVDSGAAAPAPAPASGPAPAPAPAPAPTPTPPPTPDPTPAADCSSLALCDGFEGRNAGDVPDPLRWAIGGPNCFSGAGKVVIDGTQFHSGNKSVRIDPGSDYCGHAFIVNPAIATLGPVRYGRFYLRVAQALGDAHVTFASMREANDSSSSNSQELRIGGQSGILMWNRSKDDATLPSLSPVGISKSAVIAANTWACIEFRVDQASGSIQTWLDGVAIEGLLADATPSPDVDTQWINQYPSWRPNLTDLKLGWEAYGGAVNTVWIDDVAVGNARIGCATP